MYIVMISPEIAPVAKVGGLADVVYGLSRELEIRGHSVEIILPKYDCMWYDQIWGFQEVFNGLWVPYFEHWIHCTVYFGFVHGRKCFFIDPHADKNFFNRGLFYGHYDDAERFAFFCRAALEFMFKAGKHPDVIHCHDWQTGLVPVLLYGIYQHLGMTHPRVCYTLHNLKHQGTTSDHILREVGLDPGQYHRSDRIQDDHNPYAINLMKGGIVYSNFVTTVSPMYAWDIRHSDQGYGLGHTLHSNQGKFGGILNGIDYDIWNPEIDPHIPSRYGVNNIDDKYNNKAALRHRLLLRDELKPIICVIGRLDHQKGVHLIKQAMFYAMHCGWQFVLLGSSPEYAVNEEFCHLKRTFNDNPDCHLEISYDDALSHLIYAGADMIVIPSMFEPCGLTQMIAMRYGTIPIVRGTGGLANTVFDINHSDKPENERNGYVFYEATNEALEHAMHRAVGLYYEFPERFREAMITCMNYDYSWNNPAQHYLNIYEFIREK
ncbi:MAG: glycogen synthase [Candidatus Magnetobacterium sp. LHC-1]|uniref:Glycogen synthase n=1 Tax=Candidatus Magnetobacterium casense TaxID=1455061 RepID=A0ABS6RUG7_9BACT|nr:glycogen synthase [Candidatus Magnetobacterium casensis]MBV6340279.1 glycogen synthase [Candidatus Magnetobacterium casensis]